MKNSNLHLTSFIDSLQAHGRYTFSRAEAQKALNISSNAFRFAVLRLIKKNRVARPIKNFYVIVPTEYQLVATPPAIWFIDQLMKFHNRPYYVGLLSAAALHGAAHQQPQVFQVITNKPLRMINLGRISIEFFVKKNITTTPTQTIKTPTGYVQVSTPEITAFDLIKYFKSVGYLSHVATVLVELQDKFNLKNIENILNTAKLELPDIQRLGYLLEIVAANSELVYVFKKWVKAKMPRATPLRPDKSSEGSPYDSDWRLYINEHIEADL